MSETNNHPKVRNAAKDLASGYVSLLLGISLLWIALMTILFAIGAVLGITRGDPASAFLWMAAAAGGFFVLQWMRGRVAARRKRLATSFDEWKKQHPKP